MSPRFVAGVFIACCGRRIQQIVPCCRDVFVESWAESKDFQQIVPCRRDIFVESWAESKDFQQIVPCRRDVFVESNATFSRPGLY